jgi:hypothetical protein
MKTLFAAILCAATLASAQAGTEPTETADGAPALLVADRFAADADLLAVDQVKRKVTLKASDGKTTTLAAGPEINNPAQLKAGDKVRTPYSQSLTLVHKKGGNMRSKTNTSDS